MFDSQEAVILGVYADSLFGMSGSTAYGHILLTGSKETKDDIHYVTGKMAGVSRSCGKSCVYAMSYGAGFKTVVNTIRTFHPEMDPKQAEIFAKKTIKALKGEKGANGRFSGGTGSQFFNKILDMLQEDHPCTPLLRTRMQPSLIPKNSGENGSPSQMNWFVQSCGSATGMLSALITAATWLFKRYKIDETTRNLVEIHDECWFLAKEEDAEFVAYLLQVAHAWVWSLLHFQMGVFDMPLNRVFASGIAIDEILRKESDQPVKTPTFSYEKLGKEYKMQELVNLGYSQKAELHWNERTSGGT